jgi:hypothetical protein
MLMYASFREDMDPRVFSGRVEGGGGKGVETVGAIGEGTGCKRVGRFESTREIRRWL